VKYTIFRIDTVTETLGTKGDVALCIGDVVWVKYDAWKVALKGVEACGRPEQTHPILGSCRRLDGIEWKARTTWNKKKRGRERRTTPQETD